MMQKAEDIANGIRAGDLRSISRAITLVEDLNSFATGREIIKNIYASTGKAGIIGITGPPGVGKSTIIGNLSSMLKAKGKKVAIIAVDASSPFTNGSFLGNRIRMQGNLYRDGIYMRSLSSRGSSGGLSRSTWDAVRILDAAGFDRIIVETVGAGQADLDILGMAHTIAVVLAPGLGDEIQAIKAGLMEIANVFIINKMDRDGAFIAMKDIEDSLALTPQNEWKIPVIGLDSIKMEGYGDLIAALEDHLSFAGKDSGNEK
ncbi:ArgK protein, partial [mine drainage metagenome]